MIAGIDRIISIVRDEQRPAENGQEGRVLLDGLLVGPTLERIDVMIKPGVYRIRHHNSENHPHSIQILVPDRNWILIHTGRKPPHSKGCVLTGTEDLDGSEMTGGASIAAWLAKQVGVENYPADGAPIPGWVCVVHEPGGDVLDGVLR